MLKIKWSFSYGIDVLGTQLEIVLGKGSTVELGHFNKYSIKKLVMWFYMYKARSITFGYIGLLKLGKYEQRPFLTKVIKS